MEKLEECFEKQQVALISGPSGSGKTLLAQDFAAQMQSEMNVTAKFFEADSEHSLFHAFKKFGDQVLNLSNLHEMNQL